MVVRHVVSTGLAGAFGMLGAYVLAQLVQLCRAERSAAA